ncbi:MAG TPA: hypothetical protein VMW27_24660 [Thermoanaerobaculia bacterium]|nr:hypothetical protein [Thermoanaerobaculia bacterium]
MATNRIRLLFILVLTLTTASYGYGEEPRNGRVAAESTPQARAALAAAIPRRESALALRRREDVLAEVKQRMQEMGVRASAEELTDLLLQAARLEIGRDKCSLGLLKAGSCSVVKGDLAGVELRFLQATGLSPREFRSGRRDTPPPAATLGPQPLSKSQTCTCALSVYSGYRWMNPWWGLEVGGHASHGYCSNNVDYSWPHTPGSGAMTGDIDLYFGGGAYHQHKGCEDDHLTCFHGPSTGHSGEWGNVFSCDTLHSQYTNPNGSFYGGALSDSLWVHQLSTPYVTVAGSCNGNYVSVKEYIQENDPGCCDDPMGDLWATVQVADGSGVASDEAEYTNCNGGSQSGVPPHCGSFGATIYVAYICSTAGQPDPPCDPDGSGAQYCYDAGGSWDPNSCYCQYPCYHDGYCAEWDDINCVCLRN